MEKDKWASIASTISSDPIKDISYILYRIVGGNTWDIVEVRIGVEVFLSIRSARREVHHE